MHACLLLGFEGQYRGSAGGDSALQRVRRDVYQTLRHVKARADDDISPRWRGLALRMGQFDAGIPLWAIASGAAALLAGVFFLLRFLIGNDGEALASRLVDLHPTATIGIVRPNSATNRRRSPIRPVVATYPERTRRGDRSRRHGRRAGRRQHRGQGE